MKEYDPVHEKKRPLFKNLVFFGGVAIVALGLYGAFKKIQSDRAKNKQDKESRLILDKWQENKPQEVSKALFYLKSKGDYFAFEKALEMKSSESEIVRAAAVKTIALFPSDESYQALNGFYYDSSKMVRMALVTGLGESAHKSYFKWLSQLSSDSSISFDEQLEALISLLKVVDQNPKEFSSKKELVRGDLVSKVEAKKMSRYWLKLLRLYPQDAVLREKSWDFVLSAESKRVSPLVRFYVVTKDESEMANWEKLATHKKEAHQRAFVSNLHMLCFADRIKFYEKVLLNAKTPKKKFDRALESFSQAGQKPISSIIASVAKVPPESWPRKRRVRLDRIKAVKPSGEPCGNTTLK